MRKEINLGITWGPSFMQRDLYPITERTLTQEDMDRVWPGKKLPETFRKGEWKHVSKPNG